MAASIVNISLALSTSTGLQNALQGVIANGLTITSYTDGTGVPTLSNGRCGEIAGALYRVEGGDFAVDVTAVSGDGTYYIYIEDTGSGVEAYADATVPTWRGDLGGYYLSAVSNVKAFFRFVKSGSNYIKKSDLIQKQALIPSSVDFNGTFTGDVYTDSINEETPDSGITIDGAKIKDSDGYFEEITNVAGTNNPIVLSIPASAAVLCGWRINGSNKNVQRITGTMPASSNYTGGIYTYGWSVTISNSQNPFLVTGKIVTTLTGGSPPIQINGMGTFGSNHAICGTTSTTGGFNIYAESNLSTCFNSQSYEIYVFY